MVKLGMDPKEADQALRKFEKNLKDTGRRMESIGKTMSIGFTAPFLLGMRQAIKAYDEETLAITKLDLALGKHSKKLIDQASAIQKTTLFNDDAIISIQAWAAALGHSENDISKMTGAAINLSTALGISLEEAMTGLHRTTLGVTRGLGNLIPGLKDLTVEQLKAGGGIELISKRFDGMAIAAGNSGAGALKKFENQFGDLMEQFGQAGLPLLNKIIEKFSKLTEWFDKLSPATKEMLVNIGAFVALAGPIMLITSKVITLTQSIWGLASAMKGVALAGGGLGLGATLGIGASYGASKAVEKGFGGQFAGNFMAPMFWVENQKNPKSSQFGQNPSLIPGYQAPDNSGMLMSTLAAAPLKDITPPGGPKGQGQKLDSGWWKQDQFSTPREQYANDSLPMRPFNLDLTMIERAIPKLDDLKSGFSGVKDSILEMSNAYAILGDGIANVVTDMAAAFGEGSNAFAAFGKAALGMAAQVVKAMLAVVLAKATAAAAQGGPVAAVIGLGVAIGVVETLQSMIGKIKVPKLAQGGATAGPMMAMIGDNPSGKEMVMPWEKTGDFARKIGREMGGGGGNMSASVVLRGDDLHMVVKKAQDRAVRRGSGNTITF